MTDTTNLLQALEEISKACPAYNEFTIDATLSDFGGNADDYARHLSALEAARIGDIARQALPSPSVHRQASADPTDLCPGCHGSGEQQFMTQHLGPNDYEVAGPCSKCGGSGVVDDGFLTHSEGGIRYENGPIKCVKDCPSCKGSGSAPQSRQASAGQEGVTDEQIDAVDDLVTLVRRLVRALGKAAPDNALIAAAVDYLQRKGFNSSPFRSACGFDRDFPALSTAAPESGWPMASKKESASGWTLDYRFLERVTSLAASRTELTTSLEATEQVLIAAREVGAAAPTAGETL